MSRKYKLNESTFDHIDSEEKAYWLGFILADGNICIRKSGQCVLKLALQEEDKEHLEKFCKFLDTDMPVKTYNNISSKSGHNCEITITSRRIVDSLKKLGIESRKSHTVEFPKIREDLNKHLIRGIWDGDGSVLISKKSKYPKNLYPTAQICGNRNILNTINEIFEKELYLKKSKLTSTSSIYLFRKDGRNAKKIIEFLYSDSTIYLDRKLEKAKFALNWKPKKSNNMRYS